MESGYCFNVLIIIFLTRQRIPVAKLPKTAQHNTKAQNVVRNDD